MSLTPPKGRKPVRPASASPQSSELSRHLVRAQEEERKRISRELHDGTGQGLMVLRLYLGMLGSGSLDTESQLKVQEAMGLLDRTIEELRRIIGRLSPRTLEERGLLSALRKEAREVARNAGMKATLELAKGWQPLDHETELAIYRSVQEALHNIAKHSAAKHFRLRLRLSENEVHLLVEDDGVGFSRRKIAHPRAFGLRGLRERIAALGGRVRITSEKGKGTRLRVTLPAVGRDSEPAAGDELGAADENGGREGSVHRDHDGTANAFLR